MPEKTFRQTLDKLIANITINLWLSKINNGEDFEEEDIEEIVKKTRR